MSFNPERGLRSSAEETEDREKDKERERRWREMREEVESWEDETGRPVEENIKETVVALNMMEVPTYSSCEGHLEDEEGEEDGLPVPYVDIRAPNMPEEQYIGQKEAFQEVAEQYGLTAEDLDQPGQVHRWQEAISLAQQNGETEAYQEWRQEQDRIRERVEKWLEEFYTEREKPENGYLHITEDEDGVLYLEASVPYPEIPEEEVKQLTEAEKENIKKQIKPKLKTGREEMQAFVDFLYQKYVAEEK